jgi:hypothetical protein
METPEGRAIVTVALNGHGSYRFAVETGSPDVMMTPKLISELGFTATGPGETDSMFRLDSPWDC